MNFCKKLQYKRQQEGVKPGLCVTALVLCYFGWLWLPCKVRPAGQAGRWAEGVPPSGGAAPGPVGPGAQSSQGSAFRGPVGGQVCERQSWLCQTGLLQP